MYGINQRAVSVLYRPSQKTLTVSVSCYRPVYSQIINSSFIVFYAKKTIDIEFMGEEKTSL